ncbi:MAG: PEP-CTERM sorting domain-containing protein [Methylophilaceae bacterium]
MTSATILKVNAVQTATLALLAAGLMGLSSVAYAAMSVDEPIMTAVPEPETYALLLVGLGFVGLVARRRRSKR